jgi:hypothetical protein
MMGNDNKKEILLKSSVDSYPTEYIQRITENILDAESFDTRRNLV